MLNEFLYFLVIFFLVIFFQAIFLKLNYLGLTNFYAPGLLTNLNITEPVLANIYFFWLDLSYLPMLYIILTLFLFSWRSNNLISGAPLFLCFLFFYTIGLVDFFALNSNLSFSNHALAPENTFLTNNLNKYHPLLFYTSVTLLTLFLIFNCTSFNLDFHFQETYHNVYFLQTRLLTLLLNTLALILGGWWALQEWTWGGWWNWDPSETFGLGVAIIIILTTHSVINLSETSNLLWRQNVLFLLLLFFMVAVQLNFEVLSHNFGLKFFHFFNTNFSLLLSLLILTSSLTIASRNFLSNSNELKLWCTWSPENSNLVVLTTLLSLLIATPLFLSFTPLLNHISWNFFTLTLISAYSVYPTLILTLALALFASIPRTLFVKGNLNLIFWTHLSSPLNLGFFGLMNGPLNSFHLLLIFGALTNLLGLNNDFFSWIGFLDAQGALLEDNFFYQLNSIYWGGGGLVQDFVVWNDINNSWAANQNLHLEYTNGLIEYPLLYSDLRDLLNLRFNHQSSVPIYLETSAHGIGVLANTVLASHFLGIFIWCNSGWFNNSNSF